MIMNIDIEKLSGSAILSGAINGKILFTKLIDAAQKEPQAPIRLIFDFRKIEVAAASFLRESVFAFKNHTRTVGSNYYPVVANISDAVAMN